MHLFSFSRVTPFHPFYLYFFYEFTLCFEPTFPFLFSFRLSSHPRVCAARFFLHPRVRRSVARVRQHPRYEARIAFIFDFTSSFYSPAVEFVAAHALKQKQVPLFHHYTTTLHFTNSPRTTSPVCHVTTPMSPWRWCVRRCEADKRWTMSPL